jgi:predicted PurR-regulated permease PerM
MTNNLITTAYIIYLPIVILLTWYVAHTLFGNAKVFMMDIFNGKQEIAMSTNKLFEVGFYLINIGFAFWFMQINNFDPKISTQDIFEILSTKIGSFAIYLGLMLFGNLYLFFRGRKISRLNRKPEQNVPITE